MIDDVTGRIMLQFPDIYNNQREDSKLVLLMGAIGQETKYLYEQQNKIGGMVGIDTTAIDDLEERWGKLLSLPKRQTETYEQYRQRLKLSIQTLSGGTAESIKFALSVALNYDTSSQMDRISVYDAWEYNGEYLSYIQSLGYDLGYGSVICIVDLKHEPIDMDIPNLARSAIYEVKAAGINVNFIMVNWAIIYYVDMDQSNYVDLNMFTYDKLGG